MNIHEVTDGIVHLDSSSYFVWDYNNLRTINKRCSSVVVS